MALKAAQIAGIGIPNVGGQVPENASLCSTRFPQGVEMRRGGGLRPPKFVVIGHRGNGMNVLQSTDRRMNAFKENSILSFNAAADYLADFIEFDVQVTKDDCPVIFHDDFILSQENDLISEKRITELSLAEFLSYGPQKGNGSGSGGKPLVRKTNDGKVVGWCVESDDALCTLQEALEKVSPSLGFNIELKFDDYLDYEEEQLLRPLRRILQVVFDHGKDRPILFSTFQPDAALLVKKLQSAYPVFFLTNGGTEVYSDVRRNSLEEAMKLCVEGGLEGVVSEVKGVFMNPGAVNKIKESNLSLLTYGKLNNVAEAVYIQHLMGVDGVIVDFVQEITQAVSHMLNPPSSSDSEEEEETQNPQFSPKDLSFLLKLIPQLLIQQH